LHSYYLATSTEQKHLTFVRINLSTYRHIDNPDSLTNYHKQITELYWYSAVQLKRFFSTYYAKKIVKYVNKDEENVSKNNKTLIRLDIRDTFIVSF